MLAVEFSPKTWEEVKCQGAVVRTLKSMLTNNNPPRSSIFSGSTGTGKTTLAKILAASLVCKNIKDGNPCGNCPDCVDIFNDSFTRSVKYINGIVDSGIDFYRKELNSFLDFSSFFSKNKVMIVDEVHGLSKESLQAFLLPLESKNQDNVYFIFATTEGSSVKSTLITRCVDFKLKAPSSSELTEVLTKKLLEKKLRLPKEFLEEIVPEIAEASKGSFRYAFNILEKVLASKEYNIEKVRELLGVELSESYIECINYLIKGKIKLGIHSLEGLLSDDDINTVFNTIFKYVSDINLYLNNKIPCGYLKYVNQLSSIFNGFDSKTVEELMNVFCNIIEKFSYTPINKYYLFYKILEIDKNKG